MCADQKLRLVKVLDGEQVLAEAPLAMAWGHACHLRLRVQGVRLSAFLDGQPVFDLIDPASPLLGGGIALVVREGTLATGDVSVRPTGSAAANHRELR
jgi:hypothetical protein